MQAKKERIWELDALRGLMILFVVVLHALFFAANMLRLYQMPRWLAVFMQYGGTLFVLLSGLCATLGSRSFRRGLLVFACGMLLTLGSMLCVQLGFLTSGYVIRFGVLHLLGVCMMLYPLLKRLPTWALGALAAVLILAGFAVEEVTVESSWLFPLGLTAADFSSGDYFPLLPHLGWFCAGAVLGRLLYSDKTTRFPQVNAALPPIRFLCLCGRNSLWIFLLHLPLVGGILMLFTVFLP